MIMDINGVSATNGREDLIKVPVRTFTAARQVLRGMLLFNNVRKSIDISGEDFVCYQIKSNDNIKDYDSRDEVRSVFRLDKTEESEKEEYLIYNHTEEEIDSDIELIKELCGEDMECEEKKEMLTGQYMVLKKLIEDGKVLSFRNKVNEKNYTLLCLAAEEVKNHQDEEIVDVLMNFMDNYKEKFENQDKILKFASKIYELGIIDNEQFERLKEFQYKNEDFICYSIDGHDVNEEIKSVFKLDKAEGSEKEEYLIYNHTEEEIGSNIGLIREICGEDTNCIEVERILKDRRNALKKFIENGKALSFKNKVNEKNYTLICLAAEEMDMYPDTDRAYGLMRFINNYKEKFDTKDKILKFNNKMVELGLVKKEQVDALEDKMKKALWNLDVCIERYRKYQECAWKQQMTYNFKMVNNKGDHIVLGVRGKNGARKYIICSKLSDNIRECRREIEELKKTMESNDYFTCSATEHIEQFNCITEAIQNGSIKDANSVMKGDFNKGKFKSIIVTNKEVSNFNEEQIVLMNRLNELYENDSLYEEYYRKLVESFRNEGYRGKPLDKIIFEK